MSSKKIFQYNQRSDLQHSFMKKYRRKTVLLMLLACLLISYSYVQAEPLITSASETDYPPFCMVDSEGKATGFSVELMRRALSSMGHKVNFRIGDWTNVKGWLENGEIQALPLVGRTPEREPLFDFTFPYMSLHGAVVVRKDTYDISKLSDLYGKKVAVMKNDNAEEFLRRNSDNIDIYTTKTFEEALFQLSQGHFDAVVIQRLVAIRLIQETGLKNLKIIDKPVEGFRQDFCFAVREGDRETLALLNEGLALVIADGTHRHLHAKWFAALELPSDKQIVVGGDYNFPPYEYLDKDGRPAGYNVDLVRAVADEVGLDIEIRLGPWSKIVNGLEQGEIDAIQGMFYSRKRDLKFDFSQPHTVNHYFSVVRRGGLPAPENPEELDGMRIVLQRNDIAHEFALQNGFGDQIVAVDAQEKALRELAEGNHDCALVSRVTAHYWIEKAELNNLVVGQKSFLSPEYCLAVANNQKALLSQFSEGLKILEEKGEYRRIHEKWLGVYEQSPPSLINALRYSAMIFIPLIMILVSVFIWSWSLRRQVAKRTAELQKSEKQYRLLANNVLDVIWTMDMDLNFTYINPACFDITGYTADELIGNRLQDYCDKMNFEKITGIISDEINKGPKSSGVIFEAELIKKNGDRVPVEIHGKVIFDDRNHPKSLQGISRDISERKFSQQRIDHLNKVLRAVRDVNQLIIHEKDLSKLICEGCRLLVVNRGYIYSLIILTDKHDKPVLWALEGLKTDIEPLETILQKGSLPPCCQQAHPEEILVMENNQKTDCRKFSGEKQYTGLKSMCVRLIHNGHSFGYLAVAVEQDLEVDAEEKTLFTEMAADLSYAIYSLETEKARKKSERECDSLQNQLIQAQKMEAIGRLAGGVAHDFNNMLGVISGYAELAMDKADSDSSLHEDLKEILDAARRSSQITRQLLAFARRQPVRPKVLDLNEIVESMLKMLRRLMGEHIDLTWKPGSRLWPVKIDPAQLDQILANLCVNARDAITDNGKIIIETHKVVLDEYYCADPIGIVSGDYVLLAVSDNGCGMDKTTLESIYEPFFTTKGINQGTGLGLPTVYGIVKQNDGFINVYSEPDKGTTFKIYLPRHRHGGKKIKKEIASDSFPAQGETLLIVEDEPAIMKMGKTILEKLGYRVLAAGSPGEALRLAKNHEEKIHLLITDVVMPEMNGRDLSEQMHQIYPEIKTLFMSGYTSEVIVRHGILDRQVQFIQKPFSRKDLGAKIREVLANNFSPKK